MYECCIKIPKCNSFYHINDTLVDDFSNLTPRDVTKFRYTKIMACDVERSFSEYKN